jgi:hypothetical protein
VIDGKGRGEEGSICGRDQMEKDGGQSGDVPMIADIIRDANSGSLLLKGGEFSELILAWAYGVGIDGPFGRNKKRPKR